jgi:hypothetical protein
MTRAPRLSARMRALNEAAEIAEERARICRQTQARWELEYPEDKLGAATEHAAAGECDVVARLIRERMQNRRAKP